MAENQTRPEENRKPEVHLSPAKKVAEAIIDGAIMGGSGLVSLMSGLLAAVLIMYSGYVLYDSFHTEIRAATSVWDLQQYKPEIFDDYETPLNSLGLSEINEDYRAWLTIYDSSIDYPVMQGPNDLYYASHDIYKNSSLTGAIYLAAGNSGDFSDSYNLLYGHHMDNGAMFGSLDAFKDEDYFRSHRDGVVVTRDKVFDITFFAVADTDAYEGRLYTVGDTMDTVLSFLRSGGEGGVGLGTRVRILDETPLQDASKIIALSTCAAADGTSGRLVIFGVLTERHLVTVKVQKVWDDDRNRDGRRPETLRVTLSNGREDLTEKILSEENGWTAEVPGLPMYHQAEKVEYTWREETVPEYTLLSMETEGYETTIVNHHDITTSARRVRKVWQDNVNQDGKRPESLKMFLTANDAPVAEVTVTAEKGWEAEVQDLPVYDGGREIVYTWTEEPVKDYTPASAPDSQDPTLTIMTNTHVPETAAQTLKKEWDDGDNQDGKRPEKVTAVLMAQAGDESYSAGTVELTEENGWQASVEGLPVYAGGREIVYTWQEEEVQDYVLSGTLKAGNVTTLTNRHETDTTLALVTKDWEDQENQDGLRPPEITVNLTASLGDETREAGSVTLNEENSWTGSITGLPAYENGERITYTWTEPEVPGYTSEARVDGTSTTLINTHVPETQVLTVEKTWLDNDNQDGIRPTALLVKLFAGDREAATVALNEENLWHGESGAVPVYADGQRITYRWEETLPDGYTVSAETEGTLTRLINTHTPRVTTASAEKIWNDNNNQDGIRPSSLTVTLHAERAGEAWVQDTFTLTEQNAWKVQVENLPMFIGGQEVTYTWSEEETPGYEGSMEGSLNAVFTNTHVPETTSATVHKVWDDKEDQDGMRPDPLTVTLMAEVEGEVTAVREVPLSSGMQWTYSAVDLPRFDQGREIHYSWQEQPVAGYTSVSSVNGSRTTLTNTHDPETTSRRVVKTWVDNDNQDGMRPSFVTVRLTGRPGNVERVYTLRAEDGWTLTADGLPRYAGGQEIVYTWSENSVLGYTPSRTEENGVTRLTNTHVPATRDLTVWKVWEDNDNQDGLRPDTLKVTLYAGEEEAGHVLLNAANDWTGTLTGLPVNLGGQQITYTWQEEELEGYAAKTAVENGVTVFTNTHVPETVDLSVIKVWQDMNNQDGLRKPLVNVTLLADGKEVETAALTAEENWTYTAEDLPVYAMGRRIAYTWQEEVPEGYTLNQETEDGVTRLYNTHAPEKKTLSVRKQWNDRDDQDGLRPETLRVTLLADGAEATSVTLSESNGWTASVPDMPAKRGGREIRYTWQEEETEGYTSQVTVEETENGPVTVLINTHEPRMLTLQARKEWQDNENRDGLRPETVTVHLMADGAAAETAELSENNGWTVSYEKPACRDGRAIQYSWLEEKVDDYAVAYIGTPENMTVRNTHQAAEKAMTVEKVWSDGENRDGIRPGRLEVTLLARVGEVTEEAGKVVLTQENSWTATLSHLPAYRNGEEITYSWQEEAVEGYTLSGSVTAGDRTVLTNLHETGTTTVEIVKIWNDDDNRDGLRPETLDVTLVAAVSGKENRQLGTYTLRQSGGWEARVENLPLKEDGQDIRYSWQEEDVPGYRAEANTDGGITVITNTHVPEPRVLTINKIWEDNNNQDGIRPASVQMILRADGEKVDEAFLTENTGWTYTTKALPVNRNGRPIRYSWVETETPGYAAEKAEDGNTTTFTNTHVPGTQDLTIEKVWADDDNRDGLRPDFVTVSLVSGEETLLTAVLNAENNWTYTAEDMPLYRLGERVPYAWQEEVPEGYEASQETRMGRTVLTNTHVPETKDLTVRKAWTDGNNQDGIRPDEIRVKLLAGGTEIREVTLNAANGWTYTAYGLPVHAPVGQDIVYTWQEEEPEGYNATTTVSGSTTVLTNTHVPETTDLMVRKVWADDENRDGLRPENVQVTLMAGGASVRTVTLNAENSWTYTASGLPVNRQGSPIRYSWQEEVPEGYLDTLETEGSLTTITNTHASAKKTLTVRKVWVDGDNRDGLRPDSITVTLQANGVDAATLTLSEENRWTASLENMPVKENGAEIAYTFTEETLAGYAAQILPGETETVIINTHVPETRILSIQKVWSDGDNRDGIRPESVTVHLLADGNPVERAVLSSENLFTASFEKYANRDGQAISYSWMEEPVEGYSAALTGETEAATLTNTHAPMEKALTVRKIWDDGDNQDGIRPESLTVTLTATLGDKTETAGEVVLTEENGWTATIPNLPVNRAGEEILYSWQEETVNGYTLAGSLTAGNTTTLTNRHETDTTVLWVTKVWEDDGNRDGIRPDELEVHLLSDAGTENARIIETFVLNEENGWTAETSPLPAYRDGEAIRYSFTEETAAGYRSSVTANGSQTVITNTHVPEAAALTVQKIWDDADNQDGIRPDGLVVTLEKNGEVLEEVLLNSANQWTYTTARLPIREAGQEIRYAWREPSVDGYTSVKTEDGRTTVFTNTHAPATMDLTVRKVWDDDSNRDGIRPDHVNVALLAGDRTVVRQTLSEENDWTYTAADLPVYRNGREIAYSWYEAPVAGYTMTTETENGVTELTNTHVPQKKTLTLQKVWQDGNNQDGLRPESITVTLYADGEALTEKTLDAANQWQGEITDLPVYSAGREIVYTFAEPEITGYAGETLVEENHTTMTNTHVPETVDLTVRKTWQDGDNQDGIRPVSVTVLLRAAGETVQTVTLSEENGWTCTARDLPAYREGTRLAYTWQEVPVEGYEAARRTENGVTTLTNTHVPETTLLTLQKVWQDHDNQDGIRPASVDVTLLAGGEEVQTLTLTAENGWTETLEDLPVYRAGQRIRYTFREHEVPGYSGRTETEGTVVRITNTHVPETTILTLQKVWQDGNNQDGIRPDELTVTLLKDGEEEKTLTLTAEKEWEETLKDLPVYREGRKISWTFAEESPAGYTPGETTEEDGATVLTNIHVPETKTLTVRKVWQDSDNQDGLRPEQVEVTLYGNGRALQTLTLTAENLWQAEAEVPVYENGSVISWSFTETVPAGYTAAYTTEGTETTITNTHVPETADLTVRKLWDDMDNRDGVRPETLQVQLLDGENAAGTVTLSEENGWTAAITGLPVYRGGEKILYTWQEADAEGYALTGTATADHTTTLVNRHETETTLRSVFKVWDDFNNQDGIRPESLTVTLMKHLNGEAEPAATAVLSEENGWSATVTDLPVHENGQEILYSWTEEATEGYVQEASVEGAVTVLTNTHVPETTLRSVSKVWNDSDNQDGIRPERVEITLHAVAGGEDETRRVLLNEANGWSHTFTDLPVYRNGEAIAYSFTEAAVEGYTAAQQTEGTETVFTNTHAAETVTLVIEKVWADENNRDGIRPGNVTLSLTGEAGGEIREAARAVLSEANGWRAEVPNLPARANGETIRYSWTEEDVTGYTAEFVTEGTYTTLTNRHIAEMAPLTLEKVWEDGDNRDGIRPDSIQVTLLQNGEPAGDYTLQSLTGWTVTTRPLPVYAGGQRVLYSWQETPVEGYTSSLTQAGNVWTLTNTHVPQTQALTVQKVWADGNNQDGLRPAALNVTLTRADTGAILGTYALTEANGWTLTVPDLPVYEEGRLLSYAFTEQAVAGYTAQTAVNGTTTVFTNTHTPAVQTLSVQKVWNDQNNLFGLRPAQLTVTLSAGGVPVRTANLTAQNGWTYTATDLPVNANGNTIAYTWTETPAAGYLLTGTALNAQTGMTTLTNSLQGEAFTVRKVWEDDDNAAGLRPQSLDVVLMNQAGYVQTVTLSDANGWTYTAAVPAGERADSYYWMEPEIRGYTKTSDTKADGVQTLVNTLDPSEDISYTLTVQYVYPDGSPAAPTVRQTLRAGAPYAVVSPAIPGYTASQLIVRGTMPARDLTVKVIYVPGNGLVIIEEFETPLGLGQQYMNVGDCLE